MRRCVLFLLLLVAGVVASACGEDRTVMPEFAACADRVGENRYALLTLAPGIDGIGFATRGSSTPLGPLRVLPTLGVPCARATDRAACERRAFDVLHDETNVPWSVLGPCPGPTCFVTNDVAVITAGDEVRAATLEDVVRAVLPIDTRDEAAAILHMKNQRHDCDGPNVRPTADGWVFKVTYPEVCGAVESFTKVSRDGIVTLAGNEDIDEGILCELEPR